MARWTARDELRTMRELVKRHGENGVREMSRAEFAEALDAIRREIREERQS